jgi:ferritin-like metal-binding protein YciE
MSPQVNELLLQMLETEVGGVRVYKIALACVRNDELREEWEKYLKQTERHVEVMQALFEKLGLTPEQETPGRGVVRHIGEGLVQAMELAQQGGDPAGAELVACECVVQAETKDHLNWSLLTRYAAEADGDEAKALTEACEEVEDEEDEHLYHSKGWCRELWIAWLGLPAVLPPPEEEKDVKSALDAAQAEEEREEIA